MMPNPFTPPPAGSNEDEEVWALYCELVSRWQRETARRTALSFAEKETERVRLIYVEALERKGYIQKTA